MSRIMSIKAKDLFKFLFSRRRYDDEGTKDNRGQVWGLDGNGFEVD